MRNFVIAATLVLSTAAAPPALADYKDNLVAAGTITVATTGSLPPATMIDSSGNLVGYDIDVMNAIGGRLGLEVKFVALDWAGILPGLIANRFDVVASIVTRTEARRQSTDFRILSPYTVDGVVIGKRANDDSINGWEDVCGKRLGGVRGANQLRLITENLPAGCIGSVTEYPGWTELSLDLRNGRIDWTGVQYIQSAFLTKDNPDIAVLTEIRYPSSAGLVVSARNAELADAMEGLLEEFRSNGKMEELSQKWFGLSFDWSQIVE